MPQSPDTQVEALQTALREISEALVASERRSARLERVTRWSLLGVLIAVGISLAPVLQPFGRAIAQQQQQPSRSVEEALDRINGNLAALGMVGQMMYAGMGAAVQEAVTAIDKDNRTSPLYGLAYNAIRGYLINQQKVAPNQVDLERIKAVPDSEKGKVVQGSIMQATGSVLVDAGVLMHRVRQDSNLFRRAVESMGGPNVLLGGIRDELRKMNVALASMPVMATDMNAMTQQMGVMSYSVGNTMGRASSWMPW